MTKDNIKRLLPLAGRLVGILFIFALILLICIKFLFPAFGWFARNTATTADGLSVDAQPYAMPGVSAWRFDMTGTIAEFDYDEDPDSSNKAGSWVSAVDSGSVLKSVVPVDSSSSSNTERLTFRSLHLGTIDNLLELHNDNRFYIRLDVDNELYRAYIGYSLLSSGIRIYDVDGFDRTSEISVMTDSEGNPLNLLSRFSELFIIEVAVSSSRYSLSSGDQAAVDSLFDNNSKLSNGAALKDLGEPSGSYYIYIRLTPDLEKCFSATDHLSIYMPCEITFDVTLNISYELVEGS